MKYLYFLLIIFMVASCSDASSSNKKCEDDPVCNKTEGLQCSGDIIYSCDYDKTGCLVKTPFEDCSSKGKTCKAGLTECVDKVECSDECNIVGATCMDSQTIVFCGQFDNDACNEYSEDTIVCSETQECKNGECVLKQSFCVTNEDCGGGATCEATGDGASVCTCQVGYNYNSELKTCEDIDECLVHNGGCAQNCENTDGGFECSCNTGYSLNTDNLTCSDINECELETDNCDTNATCNNTVGGYECVCNRGYEGDGTECTDIDDCADNPCIHGSCTDTGVEAYSCECESGWKGTNCDVDIDECSEPQLNNCDANAECLNTDGGFTCECKDGYYGDDGTSCEARCGDGIKAGSEECDDGNGINTDECTNTCKQAKCGDGFVQNGEECDDGNTHNNDDCTNECKNPICGDGYTWVGHEECDDGNDIDSDSCFECKNAKCGDGVRRNDGVGADEECDDGNQDNNDACLNTCKQATCGDGFIRAGVEDCDDRGESANCDADCTNVVCGDNHLNTMAGEECDDGNAEIGDGCSDVCIIEYCGDGVINNNEECDDGNTDSGDGCSSTCITEYCGDGIVNNNNEDCDDGGESANCDADCTNVVCGDNHVNTMAGEECDDAGESADCNINCTNSRCGDGVLNKSADEECDDGARDGGDGCGAGCKVESGWDCNEASPTVCIDIDECEENPSVCGDDFYCVNSPGSYSCPRCDCETANTIGGDANCKNETGQCDCLPMYEGTRTCETRRNLKIYVTRNIFNGNLRSQSSDSNGISGSDILCNNDANQPDGYYYKALLGADKTSGMSVITIRGLDNDWVLEGNMEYYQDNGTIFINTTNNDGSFDFDFTEAMHTGPEKVWTGLDEGYSNYVSTKTCNNWSSSEHSARGNVGQQDKKDNDVIQKENKRCDEFLHLYCVEQVCPEGYHYDTSAASDSEHGECVSD